MVVIDGIEAFRMNFIFLVGSERSKEAEQSFNGAAIEQAYGSETINCLLGRID
jgi:hypothetical protein